MAGTVWFVYFLQTFEPGREGCHSMIIGVPRFLSDSAVVAEEAARFRSAPPEERMRAIRSALAGGAILLARSPKRAHLEAEHERQEQAAREAISQFVVRHAQTR